MNIPVLCSLCLWFSVYCETEVGCMYSQRYLRSLPLWRDSDMIPRAQNGVTFWLFKKYFAWNYLVKQQSRLPAVNYTFSKSYYSKHRFTLKVVLNLFRVCKRRENGFTSPFSVSLLLTLTCLTYLVNVLQLTYE